MTFLSKRIQSLKPSGIRKMFDRIQDMTDPINFSIGQAHFDIPDSIKQAAIESIQNGFNRYTVTQGIPDLRKGVLQSVEEKHGFRGEDVLITCGVSGGILLSLMTLCDDGDEVLLPDPYFIMYEHIIHLCGGVPKYVDTYPDFHLRREALEAQLSEKTKILIFNTPSNPTGAVATKEEVKMVADFAREHNLILITDEIYDAFVYDQPHHTPAKYYEKTILLGGFSKSYAMPGWRVGYMIGPEEWLDAMLTLQQFTFVCAPAPFQVAAIAALDFDTSPFRDEYRQKRDFVYESLKQNFEVEKPGGAFYIFPKVPEGKGTGKEFSMKAVDNNVLIVGGHSFSQKDTHFRISYAAPDAELERGLAILAELAQ